MQIGNWLKAKLEGKIVEGAVIRIYGDDIDIELEDKKVITRKFWEVRKVIL